MYPGSLEPDIWCPTWDSLLGYMPLGAVCAWVDSPRKDLRWSVLISCKLPTMRYAVQDCVRISISVSILDPVPKLHE